MKPIIIIKETNKDGKFELTEQELKDLIEQAYEQGYADAKAEYNKPINGWAIRSIGDEMNDLVDRSGRCFTTGQPNPKKQREIERYEKSRKF